MLVNGSRTRARDDDGAVLVTVMVVMFVLTVVAIVVASLVVNTMGRAVAARSTAQSRAAADAGLTATVAAARQAGADVCAAPPPSTTAPEYSVSVDCDTPGEVVFEATGEAAGGQTTVRAVYERAPSVSQTTSPDMLLYAGGNVLVNEPLGTPGDTLIEVAIPGGDLTCQGSIQGNVKVSGNFTGKTACTIHGDLSVGGTVSSTATPTESTGRVYGSLTASGTGGSKFVGSIDGDVWVGGALDFGWDGSPKIGGDVKVRGNVTLATVKILGSLTLPEGAKLNPANPASTVIAGGVNRESVTIPPEPAFSLKWHDYDYTDGSDWAALGFAATNNIKLTGSACESFTKNPALGWENLSTYTQPTIIDASTCSGTLTSQPGSGHSAELKTDIVIVGNQWNLTNLTLTSESPHKLWLITPDKTANGTPSCTSPAGQMVFNKVSIGGKLRAMAYTPCTLNVNGGPNSWVGAIFSGSFKNGDAFTFSAASMSMPGLANPTNGGGSATGPEVLGELISQRDIP